MQITKKININVIIEKNTIYIKDLPSLGIIFGSTSVSGNLHMYGITRCTGQESRMKGLYKITKPTLRDRIRVIEARIEKLSNSLDIMKQIMN